MHGGARDGTLAGEGVQTMKSLWILALMAVCSLAALAADASGTWKASLETPNGTMENTFTLKVDGDKLTGTVTMGRWAKPPFRRARWTGITSPLRWCANSTATSSA